MQPRRSVRAGHSAFLIIWACRIGRSLLWRGRCVVGGGLTQPQLFRVLCMKYPLGKTGWAERVLCVVLEDDDGRPRRRYSRLTRGGAEQARRLLVDVAHGQARRHAGRTARRPGVRRVPL